MAIAANAARIIIIASLRRVWLWRLIARLHGSGSCFTSWQPSARCLTHVLRRDQHLPAGGGEVPQRNRRLWLRRLLGRFGVQHRVAEPPVEILAASVRLARRLLAFAFRAARLA